MNSTNLDAFTKEVQQLVIVPMTLQNDEVVVVTINQENPEWIDITLSGPLLTFSRMYLIDNNTAQSISEKFQNELFHYLYGVYKETMMK